MKAEKASRPNRVEGALAKIRDDPLERRHKKRMESAYDIRHLVMPKMISPQSTAIAQHILGTKNAEDMKQFIALVHTGIINNECGPNFTPKYDWTTGRIQCVRRKTGPVPARVKDATYNVKGKLVPMSGVKPNCPGPLDPITHSHAYVEETEVSSTGATLKSEWKCTLPPVRGQSDCDDEPLRTQLVVGPDGTGYCVVPPGRNLTESRVNIGLAHWMGDPNAPDPRKASYKAIYEFYKMFSDLDRNTIVQLNQFLHRHKHAADIIQGGKHFPLFDQYAKFFRQDSDIIHATNALHMVARTIPNLLNTNDDHLRFVFGQFDTPHTGGTKKAPGKKKASPKKAKKNPSEKKTSPEKKTSSLKKESVGKRVKVSAAKPAKKRLSVDLGTLSISDITTTSNLEL